jgi:hypothetical protein
VIFKERALQLKTHEKFQKQYGGKVFYVFSKKSGTVKTIVNIDVIDEIRGEISRLKN